FGHSPFDLERLRAMGFNICLGTDSLASNSDLSLFGEMRELLNKNRDLAPREVVEMATVNGAEAIGQRNLLGVIQPGSAADLIGLPDEGTACSVFERIVAFAAPISWMMSDGELVTS
ncbi:MAG TPA: amidohydrolase family protein, partial [Chthoniobacterales bacterium]|nr:amidohydrolase family protein [Chthoniobacterales bacterium]